MSKELVSLQNISKRYGDRLILDNISLSILEKQTLAIVGFNGCGKSTLLRIIAGLTPTSSGTRTSADMSIGYVPEHFPKLPFNPLEYLAHMGKVQGLSNSNIQKRTQELFDILGITPVMQKTWIKNLSKGSIQKIAFIQAILSTPDLLILDEPLSGQDNQSQDTFVYMLEDFKRQGISIVLACHEQYLVEKLADEVITITASKTGINSLKTHMVICIKAKQSVIGTIKNTQGVNNIIQQDEIISIHADIECSDTILATILELGGSICSVRPSNDSLDAVFSEGDGSVI